MAEQVPVVGNILALIERRDWERLERFLAPDVHWTTGIEEHLHGPAEVIAILRDDPAPGPPAFHEVDAEGRLTRWIDKGRITGDATPAHRHDRARSAA